MRDWRNAADYADLHTLDLSALAWEFLRRNPQYAQAYAGSRLGAKDAAGQDPTFRFGLRFALDPAHASAQADLFWRADVAPAHVVPLWPATGSGLSAAEVLPLATAGRNAEDGLHLRLRDGLQVVLPPETGRLIRLGALIDLDQSAGARISAVRALLGLLRAGRSRFDTHPAPARRRVVLILRALDARSATASYRDIAQHVLGADVGSSIDWRLSSARDVAIRLCRSGRRLMGGGYRRFLHRR